MLDRVDALAHRQPRAGETLDVGRHAHAEPVGLVDDRGQLGSRHLRRLGILDEHRARARRHQLDVVGAAAKLLAHRLAHLVGAVGLAVHRREDRAAGRGGRDDPPARQDPRTVDDAEPHRVAQSERLVVIAPTSRTVVMPGREQHAGGLGEDEVAELAPARELAVERGRRAEAGAPEHVARQVGVRVDQPRHERASLEVDRALGDGPPEPSTDSTETIRPSSTRTAARSNGGRPVPSITRAFQKSMCSLTVQWRRPRPRRGT